MKYKCQFPNCTYETNSRHKIHHHHITPKEAGGGDQEWNLVWLCPNHHNNIYCPGSKSGIHSIKTEDSIIILGWMLSTAGRTLTWSKDTLNNIVEHSLVR